MRKNRIRNRRSWAQEISSKQSRRTNSTKIIKGRMDYLRMVINLAHLVVGALTPTKQFS